MVIDRVDDLPAVMADGEEFSGRGYLRDLISPPGEDGVTMRRVVVRLEDVLPRTAPGTLRERWGW
jgi:hypothetical protein